MIILDENDNSNVSTEKKTDIKIESDDLSTLLYNPTQFSQKILGKYADDELKMVHTIFDNTLQVSCTKLSGKFNAEMFVDSIYKQLNYPENGDLTYSKCEFLITDAIVSDTHYFIKFNDSFIMSFDVVDDYVSTNVVVDTITMYTNTPESLFALNAYISIINGFIDVSPIMQVMPNVKLIEIGNDGAILFNDLPDIQVDISDKHKKKYDKVSKKIAKHLRNDSVVLHETNLDDLDNDYLFYHIMSITTDTQYIIIPTNIIESIITSPQFYKLFTDFINPVLVLEKCGRFIENGTFLDILNGLNNGISTMHNDIKIVFRLDNKSLGVDSVESQLSAHGFNAKNIDITSIISKKNSKKNTNKYVD